MEIHPIFRTILTTEEYADLERSCGAIAEFSRQVQENIYQIGAECGMTRDEVDDFQKGTEIRRLL